MKNEEELLLDEDPLIETEEAAVALDIFSGPNQRGEASSSLMRIREGRITFNPKRCYLYFLPPTKKTSPQPVIEVDCGLPDKLALTQLWG
jgi:hypothetical protein